eukprot:68650-Prymnesium_polylepis.1
MKRSIAPDDALAKRPRAGLPTDEVERIVELREQARRERDYTRADQLRAELRGQGIELFDADREWRAADGRRGLIAQQRAAATTELTTDQIMQAVVSREQERSAHNWAQADEIRQSLRAQGIEVDDKKRVWTAPDGRVGLLPGKPTVEQVTHVVGLREAARGKRDWDLADRLRQMLRDAGVRLEDKQGMWVMEEGQSGYYSQQAGAAQAAQAAQMQQ